MFSINAGDFRHKVAVLRPTIAKNEDNIPVEKLEELYITKAKITNIRGTEAKLANGNTYKQEKRVYIRVNRKKPILQNDIIVFDDKKFNITYINNIEEKNIYYELKMELVQ